MTFHQWTYRRGLGTPKPVPNTDQSIADNAECSVCGMLYLRAKTKKHGMSCPGEKAIRFENIIDSWEDPERDNDAEAHRILALIVTEFNNDPMSVRCFDLRLVEDAKRCVTARTNIKKDTPT